MVDPGDVTDDDPIENAGIADPGNSLAERVRQNSEKNAIRRESIRLEHKRRRIKALDKMSSKSQEEAVNIMTELNEITDLVVLERQQIEHEKEIERARRARIRLQRQEELLTVGQANKTGNDSIAGVSSKSGFGSTVVAVAPSSKEEVQEIHGSVISKTEQEKSKESKSIVIRRRELSPGDSGDRGCGGSGRKSINRNGSRTDGRYKRTREKRKYYHTRNTTKMKRRSSPSEKRLCASGPIKPKQNDAVGDLVDSSTIKLDAGSSVELRTIICKEDHACTGKELGIGEAPEVTSRAGGILKIVEDDAGGGEETYGQNNGSPTEPEIEIGGKYRSRGQINTCLKNASRTRYRGRDGGKGGNGSLARHEGGMYLRRTPAISAAAETYDGRTRRPEIACVNKPKGRGKVNGQGDSTAVGNRVVDNVTSNGTFANVDEASVLEGQIFSQPDDEIKRRVITGEHELRGIRTLKGHTRQWLMRRGFCGRERSLAVAPVEFAGGECTLIVLDLDKDEVHVHRLSRKEGKSCHEVASLAKISASVANRNSGVVILRRSGRHFVTVGQGAWRELCGQSAAHRQRVWATSRVGKTVNNEGLVATSILKAEEGWRTSGRSEKFERGSDQRATLTPRRQRYYRHPEYVLGNVPTKKALLTRSHDYKNLYRSIVPVAPRRFFKNARSTSEGGASSSGHEVIQDISFDATGQRDDCVQRKWQGEASVEPTMVGRYDGLDSICGSLPRPSRPPCAIPRAAARPRIASALLYYRVSLPTTEVMASENGSLALYATNGNKAADSLSSREPIFVTEVPVSGERLGTAAQITATDSVRRSVPSVAHQTWQQKERDNIAVSIIPDSVKPFYCHRSCTHGGGSNLLSRRGGEIENSLHEVSQSARLLSLSCAVSLADPAHPFNNTVSAPKRWTLVSTIPFKRSTGFGGAGRLPPSCTSKTGTPTQPAFPAVKTGTSYDGYENQQINRVRVAKGKINAINIFGGKSRNKREVSEGGRSAPNKNWVQIRDTRVAAGILMHASARGLAAGDDARDIELEVKDRERSGTEPRDSMSIWRESSEDLFDEEDDKTPVIHRDLSRSNHMDIYSSSSSSSSSSSGIGAATRDIYNDGENGGFYDVEHDNAGTVYGSRNSRSVYTVGRNITDAWSQDDIGGPTFVKRGRLGSNGGAHSPRRAAIKRQPSFDVTNVYAPKNIVTAMSILLVGLQDGVQEGFRDLCEKAMSGVDLRNVSDVSEAVQTIRIISPSLVVVAWAALGTANIVQEFLGDGLGGIKSISPGLPVAVVGGENDGKDMLARCFRDGS